MNFKVEAKKIENQIVNWRRDLHKIPEIGLDTFKTSKYIMAVLDDLNIEYSKVGCENGIVAQIVKDKYSNCKTFAIRADIDGLEIEENTGLTFSSIHKGRMHACGHDAHTAMLLGAAKILSEKREILEGNVKFIFQPGEEYPGGAKKMIEDGALKKPRVNAIIGLHINNGSIFEEVQSGKIGIKSGPTMASLDRFTVKIKGRGGHAAWPHKTVDPVAISASVIENFQNLISREINPLNPGVISVCMINGGTTYNVIPEEVNLEGTARFLHKEDRKEIPKRMKDSSRAIAEGRKAKLIFNYIYGYPILVNSNNFTRFFEQCAKELLGEDNIVNLKNPVMGGDDMACFLEEIPGTYFILGAAKKKDQFYPHHHPKFNIDESVLWIGSALFAKTAWKWLLSNK